MQKKSKFACARQTVNRCSPREGPVEPSPSSCTYAARLHARKIATWTPERQQKNSLKTQKMQNMQKCRNFPNFLFILKHLKSTFCTLQNTPGHSLRILEAFGKIPRHFREKSTFHENLDLSVSQKNLPRLNDFSKTHRRAQGIHSWIAFGLRKEQKLVWTQLNTQTWCAR